MINLKLSSKSKTLEDLAKILKSAKILPQVKFKAKEYSSNIDKILNECLSLFSSSTAVIVRSSSSYEDNETSSNAGGFESVLNVPLTKNHINKAILKVIESYEYSLNVEDEVFIQPMLHEVTMAGVVFTSDIDTLAPYYIINYDESGSTSTVTSGGQSYLKTIVIFKEFISLQNNKMRVLLQACKECEVIFNKKLLDIEFAFVGDTLYILQVRAIVSKNKLDLSDINLSDSLTKLYKKIQKLNAPHPKLLGSQSIFGVMPDWNPAEIIGIKPKRLALSLYKEIITDDIWAYQRDNYGYRNLRSFPLLVSFLGIPFIDVRVSFNSFIPKYLHDDIASKLVEHYLSELSKNKNHHDKIEFEIVYSCYYFGIGKKLEILKKKNFSTNEIKRIEFELLKLTNKIIDYDNGLYKKDLYKIECLPKKYTDIVNSNLSIIDKVYWLIEDCKRYGTLPFAGVARAAFIAVQFLNSLVEEKVFTNKEKEQFLNSINTVSKQLTKDRQELSQEEFFRLYGHLRPGTYDICSARYDEAYSKYFSEVHHQIKYNEFILTKEHLEKIEKLIIDHGLQCNVDELFRFIKESIEGREYAKLIFTKHLSKILSYIEEFGEKFNLNKEDLAHLDIQSIKDLYATLDHRDVKDILEKDIKKNKLYYEYTQAIKLPSLIIDADDIYYYEQGEEEANFITLNLTNAPIIDLEKSHDNNVEQKIVCIKSADPGYDYLFSKNIAGLITCYGGANSHMAIRCAELGIPAVIGCGENMFNRYKSSKVISIDALNKQVKIIS